MAVDIDTELQIISSEAKGELVRSAIADAAEAINTEAELDITTELETIRNSRWGYEIRESIHDALWKLSNAPGGTGGNVITANAYYHGIGVVMETITAVADVYVVLITEPLDWSTNYNDYYHMSNGSFVKNSYGSAPTFESDTFYNKV